jgi:hypothetical protein
VRLLGYRTEYRTGQGDPTHLYLYPYWYVTATPSDTLQARWQLLDEAGALRAEIVSGPYFNASTPSTWPPGTLIEDAYMLPLPPGLEAGSYTIRLQLQVDGASSQVANIGTITLASPVPPLAFDAEMMPANAVFDDEIALLGYTPSITNKNDGKPPAIRAGEVVTYRLYWQALKTPSENYHSYIHLIDSTGNAIAQSDQLPGPWFHPPKGWDTYYPQPDTHRLQIPPNTPGGLYGPAVGMYEIRQMDRMTVTADGVPSPGDIYRLPSIKVVGAPVAPPIERVAHFDDGFQLLGYALEIPEAGLFPGTQFQVTLYYRCDTPTSTDYTRFFHLYNDELGLAAGADSPPQNGVNPTRSWVAGEVIVDTVTLQISNEAVPGEYRLFTGFYDALGGGARLAVKDEAGQPLPNDGVVLETVSVLAR